MKYRPLSRHAAFTLIELLVVIAIIALLVSILLPSLNKAKTLAYAVVCASNQKNVATAGLQYAAEWDGVLPTNGAQSASNPIYEHLGTGRWYSKLEPFYGDDRGILYCPQARRVIKPRQYNGGEGRPDFHITTNMGGRFDPTKPNLRGPRIPSLKHLTSEKCWISAAHTAPYQGGPDWYIPNYCSFPNAELSNNYAPWMWNKLPGKNIFYGKGHPGNTANVVFGDGHVEAITESWVLDLKAQDTGAKDDIWDRWYGNSQL